MEIKEYDYNIFYPVLNPLQEPLDLNRNERNIRCYD